MDNSLFLTVCRDNYRAVFSMLRETLNLCPDELWDDRSLGEPPFWQQLYHSLWWLDFYISQSPSSFHFPAIAGEKDHQMGDEAGPAPACQQMADYLETVSQRCADALAGLSDAYLDGENTFPWTGATLAHRLVYNLRHAQHHVGGLNALLARTCGKSARWVI
jgi:hypothetical protein